MLTAAALRFILPHCPDPAPWAETLSIAADEWGIDTQMRWAYWLANIAVETGELRHLEENLAYRAETLMRLWPRRWPTMDAALPYDRDPQRIANRAYALRLGNGDEASGDGWRYRGRGALMVTGRTNYLNCGVALGLDLLENPDALAAPLAAARSAGWFFGAHALHRYCDQADFHGLVRAINGSETGLDQRLAYLGLALHALEA